MQKIIRNHARRERKDETLLKLMVSGEIMDVLAEREVALVEGRETAALTAAAMTGVMK